MVSVGPLGASQWQWSLLCHRFWPDPGLARNLGSLPIIRSGYTVLTGLGAFWQHLLTFLLFFLDTQAELHTKP